MCPVAKRFVGRVAAATEEYGLFLFKDLTIRALDPDRASYFQRPSGYHFENGLLILHRQKIRL